MVSVVQGTGPQVPLIQGTGPMVSLVQGTGSVLHCTSSLLHHIVPVVHVTGSVLQCAGSMISLVQTGGLLIHRTASVVQCAGPVQEAGGVAADQDRHRRGGLGCHGEVGGSQGVIYKTQKMNEKSVSPAVTCGPGNTVPLLNNRPDFPGPGGPLSSFTFLENKTKILRLWFWWCSHLPDDTDAELHL